MNYLPYFIVVTVLASVALVAGYVIGSDAKTKKHTKQELDELYFVYYDKCLDILTGYKRNRVSFNSLSELLEDISSCIFESDQKETDDHQYLLLYGTVSYILTEHMIEKDIIQLIPGQSIHEHSAVDDEVLSRFSEKVQPHSKKYIEEDGNTVKLTILKDTKLVEEPSDAVYHMDSVINNFYEE